MLPARLFLILLSKVNGISRKPIVAIAIEDAPIIVIEIPLQL
jgi:hypothetical protein